MALNPATLVELPEQLRGYKLLERLGRGGFGEVWKVEAPGGFLKAMKFVFGDLESTEEDGRPAEQELKALHRVKSIRHPYILSLERFDIIQGQLIIVMELADRNLWDRFRECRLQGLQGIPREELLRYMHEAAEALDLMNKHYQIQHLDIKPQNLFLVFDHIKVADFGLAKAFEGIRATVTGGVTPVYAAPETFEGFVTRFSDQYSLAIVFQELLTGQRPFNGANTKQLLLQHLRDAPDLRSLPEHDREIIGRAMSKNPNERWPSCSEMVQKLKQAPALFQEFRADFGSLPLPDPTPTPGSGLGGLVNKPAGNGMPGFAAITRQEWSEPPREAQTMVAAAARAQGVPIGVMDQPTLQSRLIRPGGQPGGSTGATAQGLVTPKLVAQRTGSPGPAVTLMRHQILETGRMGSLGIAPPEKNGDGILFPAFVVGVGQAGAAVLRRLRSMMQNRFGKLIPSVKFLFLDTDPETLNEVAQGESAFEPSEVVPTRLNRPGHYLQRDGLPPLETWLPSGMLYQLPKNPGPASGVRAFGRLALMDNYKSVVQRIRQTIEPFLSNDPLGPAAKETGLGLRTNRPRVYVVAGLGGGTGSGMFLDLAFLFKHELRQVGYREPESVGMLLLPPSDSKHVSRTVQANTFAALVEMNHYANGQQYQTRFETSESPVVDGQGAFHRTAVFQVPKNQTPKELARTVGLVARGLFLDLFSKTGRTTDYVRSVAPIDAYSGPTVQPFGLFRMNWPRPEILSCLTQRFCQHLLKRWTDKENTHLKEPISFWLTDQWQLYKLTPEALLDRIQQAVATQLREDPEAVFDAAVDTVRTRTPSAGRMDAMAAVGVLEQLIKLVGKPSGSTDSPTVATLQQHISDAVKVATSDAESHLATVAVSFLEQPQYRLAGAEQALSQITDRLKQAIETLESLEATVGKETVETYSRLFPLIGGLNSTSGLGNLMGRKGAITSELFDLLASYPRKKYQFLVVNAALTLYRGLLSGIPDYLRDVNFCRTRLESIAQGIGTQQFSDFLAEPSAYILPIGCSTLEAAADQFIAALPPDDIVRFDTEFQQTVQKKFRGLTTVCLKAEKAKDFPDLLLQTARKFLDARLEQADPAEALARYRGTGPECASVLAQAFEDALPPVALFDKRQQIEGTILAVPSGPSGEKLRQLAMDANPGIEFIPAESQDEVIIIREFPRLPLGELALLGKTGHDAYQGQLNSEHSPHSRVDIPWIAPLKPTGPQ